MSNDDATQDYIDFLLQRGTVTHILSGSSGKKISTLALTQRCLASGIACPVPLPDGTVAVHAPTGIPSELKTHDISIEVIPKPNPDHSLEDTVSSPSIIRLNAIDNQLERLEAAQKELKLDSDIHQISIDQAPDDGDRNADTREAQEIHTPAPPIDGEDLTSTPPMALSKNLSGASASVAKECETIDTEYLNEELDSAIYVKHENSIAITSQAEVQIPNEISKNSYEKEETPSLNINHLKRDEYEETAEDSGSISEFILPKLKLENVPIEYADTSTSLDKDLITSEIRLSLEALTNTYSEILEQNKEINQNLDTLESVLNRIIDQPIPRPNVTQFNTGMAKMMSAFASGLRRLEAASDKISAETALVSKNSIMSDILFHDLDRLHKEAGGKITEILNAKNMDCQK